MAKERFTDTPYPELHISAEERKQLVELATTFVQDYFQKYEDFVVLDKSQVNSLRWKPISSKDNLHVYVERSRNDSNPDATSGKILPVVLRVGTLFGDLDDLMLGAVNTTLDAMRIKSSYVRDLDSAAVLCPIVEPTHDEPFQSLAVKWMTIDAPLQSTGLVKRRDFVYIEATGVLHFVNGDQVGYNLLHSIDFPQTQPNAHVIRAKLSCVNFFRQIDYNLTQVFGTSTVNPGGDVIRMVSIRVATEVLLSTANLVHCGQMKKLSWVMGRQQANIQRRTQMINERCTTCSNKVNSGIRGVMSSSKCKLCYGTVCYSCRIRRRVSFITLDDRLTQPKISFCGRCLKEAAKCDAKDAARDQATGFEAYGSISIVSRSDTLLDECSSTDKL